MAIGLEGAITEPTEINRSRTRLCRLFKGTGVEVGTERGIFAKMICRRVPVKLYCVDPWRVYEGYRDNVDQEKWDWLYEQTQQRLAPYDCTLVKKFSMDAVKDFEDGSLDFVYIDANHNYEHVTQDILEWSSKVKVGGIVSGHDYQKVRRAIRDYLKTSNIKVWFIYTRDLNHSWMWFKV